MKCKKVSKLISSYLLDELDSVSRGEVGSHISSCPACGNEKERLTIAISSIRATNLINASSVRREQTLRVVERSLAQSYGEERNSRINKLMRIVSTPAFAYAAALIMAITAIFILYSTIFPPEKFTLRAEELRGKTLVQRNNSPVWEALAVGSKVEEGDWLSTGGDALVKFSATNESGNKQYGNIYANSNTSFRVHRDKDRYVSILIENGTLYCQLKPLDSGKYIIIDPENDRLTFKEGNIEVGLRYTMSIDNPEAKNLSRNENAKISFTSERLSKILDFIKRYTGKSVEPTSEYIAEKKVSFYSDDVEPESVFNKFESYLKEQGLTIVKSGDRAFKVVSTVKGNGALSRRLFARISNSNAMLYSQRGEITVASMNEVTVDSYGYPLCKRMSADTELAGWRNIQSQPLLAIGKIPMPALDIKFLESVTTGGNRLEYSISETGFLANVGDSIAEVSVPSTVGGYSDGIDEGEIVVPVRVRFTVRR